MTKKTEFEPEAYLYINGKHRGVGLYRKSELELSIGTSVQGLYTMAQVEDYINSKLIEEIEKFKFRFKQGLE